MWMEEDLISGLKNMDEKAFYELLNQYGNRILKLCYLKLGSLSEAEDVTQEVFIKIFRYVKDFNGRSSLYTWIYRIAANSCSNHKRSIKPLENLEKYENIIAVNASVEEEILKRGNNRYIWNEVMKLDDNYREVIYLYYYEEKPIKEISDILNCSKNTVKTRLKRARERLGKNLRGGYVCELY